jgi:uncharacterized protein
MTERLLTPSKITAWLECAHFLSLRNRADAGTLKIVATPMSELAELLVEKGSKHERDCLEDLERQGRSVYQVPGRNPDESFAQWVARIASPFDKEYDVIYQMPFVHDGIRGIADFLVRVEPEDGFARYEPIDAKLTRSEGKPGHVLQLCFYADAIEALTGAPPKAMHLWLGSGELETLVVEQFSPYWRRLRRQLTALLNRDEQVSDTRPEPCSHCEVCEFAGECEKQWRSQDSLVYVANIRPPEREAFERAGVRTIVDLAARKESVTSVHEESLERLTRQAALQVASRRHLEAPPRFEVVEPSDDPVYGHGFSLMPAPDGGDVFFDFEGHPFWTARHDLFFLAGLYLQNGPDQWNYEARWAHDLDEQSAMIKQLVEFFALRRQTFPNMHVYHYNHTERSSLERLTKGTETESLLGQLVESGMFVDLFVVARNAVRVGAESYGLKHLERLARFERSGDIDGGAGAVVQYEEWMRTRDPQVLAKIANYNSDDVRATMALRDWLVAQRPRDLEWRDDVIETVEFELDTDQLVERLNEFDEASPQRLLADLLNYWRRERVANSTPKFAEAASDFASLYPNRDFVANLILTSAIEESEDASGRRLKRASFTWPGQDVDHAFKRQMQVLYTGVGVEQGYAYAPEFDGAARVLTLTWKEGPEQSSGVPAVIAVNDYVPPRDKAGVLVHLAEQILDPREGDPPSRVSMALLARERPRFTLGHGPRDGVFTDDLVQNLQWVGHLDESYVAIQGPPGTGKTYSGSHIIYELIKQGKRVGVTAMSHAAIDNLFHAAHAVFEEKGELHLLRALRRGDKPKDGPLEGVRYTAKPAEAESDAYNLVAGTTWLWARQGMRAYAVDVLLVDEAGQLALADTIAAANGARNLILLGDPLQLAQVSQAEHPGGSGASVLEHVLCGHATIPSTQGVFISETRRMHPDVCDFISQQIYEGRLSSHSSCARQSTEFGTGLRWIEAHHADRSTESQEEADLVARQILLMIGSASVDQAGQSTALGAGDFMVVAPYNDQVRLIERELRRSAVLDGVQVGTVDKFQGREAPVVFFTMTTSSGEDMPRGPEFLFSRNRLNVAVSRARCLAYLVCTEGLLNSRARSIEEMRLIGTLSAFVEHATSQTARR